MKRIAVDGLPPEPLAAAAVFHQHWLPHAETVLRGGDDVLLAFAPADHTHRGWRLAAVQGLARASAPVRVNAVAGRGAALDAFETYLARAPGVTGQYFEGDGHGAVDPTE